MRYYDTCLNVRINTQDLELLRAYAKLMDTTPGALIRELGLAQARRYFNQQNKPR